MASVMCHPSFQLHKMVAKSVTHISEDV